MGNSHSGTERSTRGKSSLEKKLAQAIKDLGSEDHQHHKNVGAEASAVEGATSNSTLSPPALAPLSFEKTMLKSDTLKQGFDRAHSIYKRLQPQHNGCFNPQQIKEGAAAAGIEVHEEDVAAVAGTSGGGAHPCAIGFREFVMLLATEYIIRMREGRVQNVDPQIAQAFDIALRSFLDFDKNHDGFFNRDEAIETLREVDASAHAPAKKVPGNSAILARIAELDVDQDGMSSFTDYLAALEQWVQEE